MKKIMIVVPSIGTGGGEKVAISIAKYIDKTRYNVLIVSLYPEQDTIYKNEIEKNDLNILYLHKQLGIDISIVREIKKCIKQFQPDIIHTHLYVVPYVLMAAPFRKGKIHTVHNIAEKEAEGMLRVFMRIAYSVGGFTPVTISPYCRESFVKLYHYKKEVPCIYNGIDTNEFVPSHFFHNGIKFISVGRFEPQKNHRLMIEAFSFVHSMYPETILELVGDGLLRPELEKFVSDLGISDSVTMNGVSPDICEKDNQADIFLMTSDFEGLPVSVLEAMACGLPVISTNAGGTRDIVVNGKNGIIVPIGDKDALIEAMIDLIVNKEKRIKMGSSSRQFALSYSMDLFVKQYEALYETLCCEE